MSTLSNDAPLSPEQAAMAAGLDNVRKMFRETMLENARREGESVEALRERLAADPATAQLATLLQCSIDELLEGFGKEEEFWVVHGYDEAESEAEVAALVKQVAEQITAIYDGEFGEDKTEASHTHIGALRAPKPGERRAEIQTEDTKSKEVLASQLHAVRTKGAAAARAGRPKKKKPR
jgi:aryl carrier-like protein